MRRPRADREDDPASGKRSLGARANHTLGPRIVRSPALTTVPAGLIFEKTLAKCRAIRWDIRLCAPSLTIVDSGAALLADGKRGHVFQ
jgi:hypothetical protein